MNSLADRSAHATGRSRSSYPGRQSKHPRPPGFTMTRFPSTKGDPADPPFGYLAAESPNDVETPKLVPATCFQTHQGAVSGQGKHPVPIHGWRAPRSVAARFAIRFPRPRFPEFPSGCLVEGQHHLGSPTLPLGEQPALRDDEAGVALPDPLRLPDQARPSGRPGTEQACLGRDSVPVRAAPLGPVGRRR